MFKNTICKTKSALDKTNMTEAILAFCEQPRSHNELIEFTVIF